MITSVTHHAVERYRQRHRPSLTLDEARAELENLVEDAVPTDDSTAQQDEVWRAPGDVLLVVRPDGAVTTVLPPRSQPTVRRPRRRRGWRP